MLHGLRNLNNRIHHLTLLLLCRVCDSMMTSSNETIFRVTGPLCGEFTGPGEFPAQRSMTRSFDVFFNLRLNNRLSKQPWGWWFETPSWSIWRQCNGTWYFYTDIHDSDYVSLISDFLAHNRIHLIFILGIFIYATKFTFVFFTSD